MTKLIVPAVLAASLLVATSASAGGAGTVEKWDMDDGVRTMLLSVSHEPGRFVAPCSPGSCECPYENEDLGSPELLTLHFQAGSEVVGEFQACATIEKLVKDCAAKGSYETKFRGTISADGKQIHGEYYADGWGYVEKGGLWTNCRGDSYYEAWLPVELTLVESKRKAPCNPDANTGFIYMTPSNGKAALYQTTSTSSAVVDNPPAGVRLVYRQISTQNGQTWYYITPPAGTPGWAPAADTSCDRPIPLHPIKHPGHIDRVIWVPNPLAVAARG